MDAAGCLAGLTASGEEIPFEVIGAEQGERRARVPLYCYRPLTGAFIGERIRLLSALASYAPAAQALMAAERDRRVRAPAWRAGRAAARA